MLCEYAPAPQGKGVVPRLCTEPVGRRCERQKTFLQTAYVHKDVAREGYRPPSGYGDRKKTIARCHRGQAPAGAGYGLKEQIL